MATKLAKIVADFSTQLASAIAVGATSFTLQSIVDDDGNNLPNGIYYFTLDGNNSSKEHIFCTITGTSVASIFSVSRQGVATSGVVRAHRVGAQVVITDFAHILRLEELLNGTTNLDASTPLGYDGTASITTANQLATKAYVDGVAIAGAPDASTTVKGISKLSVAPVSGTNPIAVGDNDPRVPTTAQVGYIPTTDQKDALAGTGTPSAANKFVTADTDALKELLANKDTDGTLAANSDTKYASQKATKTYVDGKTKKLIAQSTSSVTSSIADINEDTMITVAIPANTLGTGNVVRLRIYGSYTEVGTGSVTLALKAKYGASVLFSKTLTNQGTAATVNVVWEVLIYATGATNSQKGRGEFRAFTGANNMTSSTGQKFINIQDSQTLAIDSTGAVNLTITTQASSTSNTPTLTIDNYICEVVS